MRNTTLAVTRAGLWVVCWLFLFGCGDKPLEADYPLEVLARAEGVGVEGVSIKLNDEEIGQTDEEGKFEGTYHGTEGKEVVLEAIPSDDFKIAEGAEGKLTSMLAAEKPKDGEKRPKALSFVIDLRPTSIEYVALIAAPGKFRPIYMGEELKGRTNALGVETMHFRGKPGSTIEIRVDTQSKKNAPLLKKVELNEQDRVVIVDASDAVKEESEAAKEERAKKAAEREQAALAVLEQKASKQGERAKEKIAEAKKAKEDDQAEQVDLAAIKAVSKKAADRIAAAPPPPPPPPPTPVAVVFDATKAKAVVKDLQKAAGTIGKMKADAGKEKGKIDKLSKQPGAAQVVADSMATYQSSIAKIDDALKRSKEAATAANAALKAKDMAEVLKQEKAGELASSDAEAALEDIKQTASGAQERVAEAVKQAKAQEEQNRASATSSIEANLAAIAAAETELKGLAKKATEDIKKAKKGEKEAKVLAKEIDLAIKSLAKPKKELTALKGKVKKAKAEALLDLQAKATEMKGEIDAALNKGRTTSSKIEDVCGLRVVATPPPAGPVVSTSAGKGKKPAPDPRKKVDPKDKKCNPDLECELEALKAAVEEGEVDRCLVAVCEKVGMGGPNAEDIHLTLAKYWGRKNSRPRQLAELDKATSFGQYKYDPSILYGFIKVAVSAGNFSKAIEIKDRFMQVKERLPVEERKAKVSEILSVLAQAYEHEFYKKQEKEESSENVTLLNSAIQFWEEYGSYSGDKAKSDQKIETLKKLREEISQ